MRNQIFNISEFLTTPNIQFFDGNKFLHHVVARYVADRLNIALIDNNLHYYDAGKYISNNRKIKTFMTKLIPQITEAQRNEVLNHLPHIVEHKEHAPQRYIGVKNGIYDIEKDILLKHSPKIVLTSLVNAKYDENATDKNIDNMIKTISNNDGQVEQLIKEMVGYTLYRSNVFGKAFLLKGEGGNGKSMLLNAIGHMLGRDNIASMSLSDLEGKFNTAILQGKLANLGDDISYNMIKDSSIFKKLVTGEEIKSEQKGKDPFFFRSFATMIFSTNRLPKIKDDSKAVLDRLVIVPLEARIRGTSKDDPFFEDKIITENAANSLFMIGIKHLKTLINKRKFIIPNSVQLELNDFEKNNNPIKAFVEESIEIGMSPHRKRTKEVYQAYKEYCKRNNYRACASSQFTTEIKVLGYENKNMTINGQQGRTLFNINEEKT